MTIAIFTVEQSAGGMMRTVSLFVRVHVCCGSQEVVIVVLTIPNSRSMMLLVNSMAGRSSPGMGRHSSGDDRQRGRRSDPRKTFSCPVFGSSRADTGTSRLAQYRLTHVVARV